MNVAIISYNHPESSLVLAKHLAEFNNVHYYYITDLKRKSIPGIGYLSNKNFRQVSLDIEYAEKMIDRMKNSSFQDNDYKQI
ncbi:MAG: hypothetical protein ACXVDW_21285, partial [Bacteroidia bacterium]